LAKAQFVYGAERLRCGIRSDYGPAPSL
jgi:hypothetical protein